MPQGAPPQPPQPPASLVFDTFSGLRNTVEPEKLGPRELARARNIDLDDAGEPSRRRGQTLRIPGTFHSLFATPDKLVFAVEGSGLVNIWPDFSTAVIVSGIGPAPLAYVRVGPTLYFSSVHNSGQIDLASMGASPWGSVSSPSYQPSLQPVGPADFWYSPVVNPEPGLGAVGGRLFGRPPPASSLAYYNGRIYLAAGPVLWATELYLYNYVDKNKGYRYFEDEITGIIDVEDGLYVGTTTNLYFLSGDTYDTQKRAVKAFAAGVLPGSMRHAPVELTIPEARREIDVPHVQGKGMLCMTERGVVFGAPGGQTNNLTQSQFIFPNALRSSALLRRQDGMNTFIVALNSEGTPAQAARFGDYLDATIIRASDVPLPPPL